MGERASMQQAVVDLDKILKSGVGRGPARPLYDGENPFLQK